jgi:hypothetical protein
MFTSTLEYAKLLLEIASSNKRQLDTKQLNSTDKINVTEKCPPKTATKSA